MIISLKSSRHRILSIVMCNQFWRSKIYIILKQFQCSSNSFRSHVLQPCCRLIIGYLLNDTNNWLTPIQKVPTKSAWLKSFPLVKDNLQTRGFCTYTWQRSHFRFTLFRTHLMSGPISIGSNHSMIFHIFSVSGRPKFLCS